MRLITLLLFLLFPTVAYSEIYDYRVLRIIDGDTIEIEAPFLPDPLKKVLHLRVMGVDTPEKSFRAKCEKERILAGHATDFTTIQIRDAKVIKVEIKKWDKYGGRVLGDLILDGDRLSKKLIDSKYAVPYYGAKKPDWCK